MGRVSSIIAQMIKSKKRGTKNLLEINARKGENLKIEEWFSRLDAGPKEVASSYFKSNRQAIKRLSKDKDTKRTFKDMVKRDKEGRSPHSRGYIAKKLKKDEEYTGPGKYKKGKFVQVKTKLGRNRPTKLY